MSLIHVEHLNFTYEGSSDPVFQDVSFQIDTDWKLGFIGRNGKGKTTFLKLLAGEYDYTGSITSSVSFEYFPYPVENKELPAWEIAGNLNPLMEQWELMRELNLLGADAEILYRTFSSLSFGEQSKILLASLFLKDHAFLLIDEPTNHLDLHTRNKIADYLSQKKGFILVSHDRDLIDRCADHMLVLNRQSIEVCRGNFSSWFHDKTDRDHLEQKQNAQLKKEIRKLKEASRRTSLWSDKIEGSKIGDHAADRGYIGHQAAKMMKRSKSIDRRRKEAVLEKEELLKDVETLDTLKLNFLPFHSRRLLSLRDVTIQYPGSSAPLFPGLTFELNAGDRIALCGKNGCGKSSLIRLILGDQIPHTGELYTASGLRISYISQDTSWLKGGISEFAAKNGIDISLFCTVLKKLGLERVQFDKKIEEYSEGQKKKVLLAKSLCEPAHLFVWDEPLNYIDIFSRVQLEKLLLSSQPSMLFVEHDLTFREKIATKSVEL
ncbi:MAG TPA: ABC-F type ribosomal protection protein [Candidatus Mediterraneibacter colneyensis]|nr:ABC-F type ribosomal protection protein [Candidatus Mediterraneibacter colneyensis]